MIFKPSCAGNIKLKPQELEEDKKNCRKIGPVGIGKKALYLNSFYLARRYYIIWSDVRRVFKRVALSKGGFTGRGLFASMAYLVVQKSDGTQQQCNFKFEKEVDQVLEMIGEEHPEIPLHSAESERKLARAKYEREAKYVKNLGDGARDAIRSLTDAEDYLKQKPENYKVLTYAAKEKRSVDGTKKSLQLLAWLIVAASLAMAAAGLYIKFVRDNSLGIYLVLFGAAFILSAFASQVLPTPNRNRRTVQRDWEQAVSMNRDYLDAYKREDGQDGQAFPVPAQYAHPVVLERMIRTIREGRADNAAEALDAVKADLRAMNSSTKVSQEEYDEVTAVKPMFLVCNYE